MNNPGDVRMVRILVSSLILLSATAAASAQGVIGAEIQLTVQPAKEPVPALKYQFLPELRDQSPGNAATHYHRAMLAYRDKRGALDPEQRRELMQQVEKWSDLPLNKLPRTEMRGYFERFKEVFNLVQRAARCERCDWNLGESIRQDGFETLLPELQGMREFANLLRDKIRLELAEGNLDEAARTLRTGFTMARHTSEAPTLISSLVSIAIGTIMLGQVDQFVQQPGAPNLYWALTDLPRPLVDVHKALQSERLLATSLFPGLREMAADLKAGPMSPQQTADAVTKFAKIAGPTKPGEEDARRLAILNMAGQMHAEAKKFLVEQGRKEEDVEKMPMIQAVLIYQLDEHDRALDDLIKLQSLPYHEAQPRRAEVETKFRAQMAKHGGVGLTLAGLFVPAVEKVNAAQVRIERKIAALRCVEAMRMYAAAHDGKPPAKLDASKVVPIPSDPFTGKPFIYKTEENKAIIQGPAPDGARPFINNYIRYEVTLKK
jgi:hypothetical protein